MAYIHYDEKANGVIYASVYESYREGGNVKTRRKETLGRVIDKEKGLFSQHGKVFQYTIKNGRKDVTDVCCEEKSIPENEKMILDFGDAWFLSQYVKQEAIFECFKNLLSEENDTVMALVFYRLLTHKGASCHAKIWYEGNYTSLLYPKANLTSQNISRMLKELGKEEVQRAFFEEYLAGIYQKGANNAGILIDSTGVPNATKMDVTQISNHNGDISREVRLIYVIDRRNDMPIYFRYVAGNIIDVTTLITTISELEQYHVSVDHVILDAGYYSEKNALELLKNKIPFMTRLAPNKPLFKETAENNLDDLMSQKYAYRYGERLVFIKKISVTIDTYNAFVYLCIDEDMYLMQHKKTILNAIEDKKQAADTDAAIKQLGAFALLATEDLEEKDLLPLYYTRQQVEQVFDVTKNYSDLLPIRVESEQTFAGHLLICFMATAIFQKLQQSLLKRRSQKAKALNAASIFSYLRNQKCKVFTQFAIPQEPRKEVNAIYDIFKFSCPYKIEIPQTT